MEVNWSTFILEIINFLVLIWILKRFIYKPVLAVIAERRTAVENQTAEAEHLHEAATSLKKQYQNRLNDWDRERQGARDRLNTELETERAGQLAALQAVLIQEREKARASQAKRHIESVREIEHQALRQGAEFAAQLLKMASGPELETRLIKLLIDELGRLSPEQVALIQERWGTPPEAIVIASVYPIDREQQQRLESALTGMVGHQLPVTYHQRSELLAGLHIAIGAWVLQANVRDELKGFEEFAYVAR